MGRALRIRRANTRDLKSSCIACVAKYQVRLGRCLLLREGQDLLKKGARKRYCDLTVMRTEIGKVEFEGGGRDVQTEYRRQEEATLRFAGDEGVVGGSEVLVMASRSGA